MRAHLNTGILVASLLTHLQLAERCYAGYIVTDLGTLGGTTTFGTQSFGTGVNDLGAVTGLALTTSGQMHAFLYSGGVMHDLGTLGGPTSSGNGINNLGQVTGSATTSDGSIHAFLSSGGSNQDLGTFGGSYSSGNGVNDAGHVAGEAETAGGQRHAFLYNGSGSLVDLGTLGGPSSSARGINNLDQVTGTSGLHAFLYSDGTMHQIGTLGGLTSAGSAINNLGHVTGNSQTNALVPHAFLFSNGHLQDLGTLGGADSYGFGINDSDQVVGYSATSSSGFHAFLYSAGSVIDLNSQIAPGSGWTLLRALDINNNGQITGVGFHNGEQHAFLLTPGTPPSSGTDLFSAGTTLSSLGYTVTQSNSGAQAEILPFDAVNYALRLSDPIGSGIAVGKSVSTQGQLSVAFNYDFLADGKLQLLIGDDVVDTIFAPASGPGRNSFATYSRRLYVPVGVSSVNIRLVNEGDPTAWLDDISIQDANVAAVPEPSSIALLGTGLLGLCGYVTRRRCGSAGET